MMMVESLWWHMPVGSTTKRRPNITHMKGSVFVVVWAISSFQCYIYGSPFTLIINHQPLKFLIESNRLTRKLARWAFILQEYDFYIIQRSGRVDWNADGLSQNPSSHEKDTTRVRWHGDVDLEAVLGWHAFWCAPKLFDRFKCESEVKTTEE
jgi:hypothetical protein